ncbi:MAG TPA: hypothetical protein VMZ30_12195 [Pyrinomonadaceae bacterium]|nr:hypothetical protein [Pyrinomonadaceae bacterium]
MFIKLVRLAASAVLLAAFGVFASALTTQAEIEAVRSAIAAYRESLQVQPDEPALLTNLAEALRRRSRLLERGPNGKKQAHLSE